MTNVPELDSITSDEIINQDGGKRKIKKAKKKQTGGRELPPAIKVRIELSKFISTDSGLKQGIPMVKLISYLTKKVKEKNDSLDAVAVVEEAKKLYLANKEDAKKQYAKLSVKPTIARQKVKKETKKTPKKTEKKVVKKIVKKTK